MLMILNILIFATHSPNKCVHKLIRHLCSSLLIKEEVFLIYIKDRSYI